MSNRILGLIIISIILILLDFYIYRAVRGVNKKWTNQQAKRFTYIWWGYSILLILTVFICIFLNIKFLLRALVIVVFFATFVSKFFILPFLLVDEIRRGFIWLKRRIFTPGGKNRSPISNGEPIPRSEFLVKTGALIAVLPFASLTYGVVSGAYDYRIRRRTLYFKSLPDSFDGMKVAQISDIHSGSFYNAKAVRGGVELLMKEKADMIFFTGDLVNNLASEMRDYQDIFSNVKAPLGVYSILGNHDYGDYYYGPGPSAAKAKNLNDVKQTHLKMGWNLLLNSNRKVRIGSDELAVIGVENWGVGRFARYGQMDVAIQGTEDVPVRLLLSHDPSHWRAQILPEYPQIDCMFSGHTHGMQFGVQTDDFQWSPSQYIYKEWGGHYQEGDQQLYVNVGYGFLGYPGRVGILPEITIFELRKA